MFSACVSAVYSGMIAANVITPPRNIHITGDGCNVHNDGHIAAVYQF